MCCWLHSSCYWIQPTFITAGARQSISWIAQTRRPRAGELSVQTTSEAEQACSFLAHEQDTFFCDVNKSRKDNKKFSVVVTMIVILLVVFQEFSDSTMRSCLCNLIKNKGLSSLCVQKCLGIPNSIFMYPARGLLPEEMFWEASKDSNFVQVVSFEVTPVFLGHLLSVTWILTPVLENCMPFCTWISVKFQTFGTMTLSCSLKKRNSPHMHSSKSPCILCLLSYSDSWSSLIFH